MQVHDVADPVDRHEVEVEAHVVGQGPGATADHDGVQELVHLVDEPGAERLGREGGPPTLMSSTLEAFSSSTAARSNDAASRVRAVVTSSRLVE